MTGRTSSFLGYISLAGTLENPLQPERSQPPLPRGGKTVGFLYAKVALRILSRAK